MGQSLSQLTWPKHMTITARLTPPATTATPEFPANTKTTIARRIGAHIDPLPKYLGDVVPLMYSLFIPILGQPTADDDSLLVCCNTVQLVHY